MEPLIINEDARVARARELFVEGYNCCQAVAMTFADVYGISEKLTTTPSVCVVALAVASAECVKHVAQFAAW